MAEIRHLEIDMTSFFSTEGGPIWIKFRWLVHNDMSTAVMWSKSKPYVEFQYGGRLGEFNGMSSQSHLPYCRVLPPSECNVMIPELRVTLQGAAAWWIHYHDSRATCHIAGCKNSRNRFFAIFYLFFFVFNAASDGFRIVSDTLVWSESFSWFRNFLWLQMDAGFVTSKKQTTTTSTSLTLAVISV